MKKSLCLMLLLALSCAAFAESSLQEIWTGASTPGDLSVASERIDTVDVGCSAIFFMDGYALSHTSEGLLQSALNYVDECYGDYSWLESIASALPNATVTLIRSELYGWASQNDPNVASLQREYYLVRVEAESEAWDLIVMSGFETDGGDWMDIRPADGSIPQELTEVCCGKIVHCDEWVSLRAEADTQSERLCKVPLGAEIEIYDLEGDFTYCAYNGMYGYILSKYVEMN